MELSAQELESHNSLKTLINPNRIIFKITLAGDFRWSVIVKEAALWRCGQGYGYMGFLTRTLQTFISSDMAEYKQYMKE